MKTSKQSDDSYFISTPASRRNIFVGGNKFFLNLPSIHFHLEFIRQYPDMPFFKFKLNGIFYYEKKYFPLIFPNVFCTTDICLGYENIRIDNYEVPGTIEKTIKELVDSFYTIRFSSHDAGATFINILDDFLVSSNTAGLYHRYLHNEKVLIFFEYLSEKSKKDSNYNVCDDLLNFELTNKNKISFWNKLNVSSY